MDHSDAKQLIEKIQQVATRNLSGCLSIHLKRCNIRSRAEKVMLNPDHVCIILRNAHDQYHRFHLKFKGAVTLIGSGRHLTLKSLATLYAEELKIQLQNHQNQSQESEETMEEESAKVIYVRSQIYLAYLMLKALGKSVSVPYQFGRILGLTEPQRVYSITKSLENSGVLFLDNEHRFKPLENGVEVTFERQPAKIDMEAILEVAIDLAQKNSQFEQELLDFASKIESESEKNQTNYLDYAVKIRSGLAKVVQPRSEEIGLKNNNPDSLQSRVVELKHLLQRLMAGENEVEPKIDDLILTLLEEKDKIIDLAKTKKENSLESVQESARRVKDLTRQIHALEQERRPLEEVVKTAQEEAEAIFAQETEIAEEIDSLSSSYDTILQLRKQLA